MSDPLIDKDSNPCVLAFPSMHLWFGQQAPNKWQTFLLALAVNMFLSLNFTLIHDVSMKEVLSKKKNSNLWDLGASRTPTILQRGIMRRTRVRFHIFFGKPGKSGRSKLFADLGANLSQIRFCFFKLDIPVLRGFFLTLCCGVFVFIAASPRQQSLEISFFAKPFGNKNCVKKIS